MQELFCLSSILYIFIFLMGLAAGSFLNSWIWRRWENIRVSRGRSICVHCHRQLPWFDNIPVISFVFLRGRCRTCKKEIPYYYVLLELGAAIIFTLIFWHHVQHYQAAEHWHLGLARDLFFFTWLVVIFAFDFLHQIILSSIVWSGVIIGFVFNYFLGMKSFENMILGAVVGGGFFLTQYLLSKGKWIGGGDVRLGIMMGVWLGVEGVIVSLFFAYVCGAIFSLFLLFFKKGDMKTKLPFGTFLAVASFFALYFTDNIIGWYLSMLRW